MRVTVTVTLKTGVLDPQGKAIENALNNLGFVGINDARMGKVIYLDLDDDITHDQIDAMCQKLLANTVIEDYSFQVTN